MINYQLLWQILTIGWSHRIADSIRKASWHVLGSKGKNWRNCMTRDWKKDKTIENAYYCWKDLILEDTFGITEKDWNIVIQQIVAYIQDWSNYTITDRVSCMVDLLIPPLQTLWQEKKQLWEKEKGEFLFRWLPCKSLQGATVADHALTASANCLLLSL